MGYICTCARARVHTAYVPPFSYLGNGWTDCAEIWYMISDPLARLFTRVRGGAQLHVRTPFSSLGNGGTACAEIWYVVRDPLAKRLTEVNDGVHVRTCAPPFLISGMAERIALKFGVWLGYH